VERYLVTDGRDEGEQRNLRVDASSDDEVMRAAAAQMEPGESVIGFTLDPERGVDPDGWAGAL
jgi:hypothetical protein